MGKQDGDAVYYRMREQRERDLAEVATVEEARAIHLKLAEEYRSLVENAQCREARGSENVVPHGPLTSQLI